MKFKNTVVVVLLFLLILLSLGCSKSSTSDLKEVGFYAVVAGKSLHQSFKEYGSGSTERSLPTNDYSNIPVLKQGDHFLLYGDLPAGPMGMGVDVFTYILNGNVYKSQGDKQSLESFFVLEPMEPLRGVKLTKFTPTSSIGAGTFFIHRYVGANGDAYLAFKIER